MKPIHRSENKSCNTCRWRSTYDLSYHKTCKEKRVEAGLSSSICIDKSAWEPEQEERTAKTGKSCETCHFNLNKLGCEHCYEYSMWVFKGKEPKPNKPAPALKPETAWLEDRIKELARAIADADEFNHEWCKEMERLTAQLRESYERRSNPLFVGFDLASGKDSSAFYIHKQDGSIKVL